MQIHENFNDYGRVFRSKCSRQRIFYYQIQLVVPTYYYYPRKFPNPKGVLTILTSYLRQNTSIKRANACGYHRLRQYSVENFRQRIFYYRIQFVIQTYHCYPRKIISLQRYPDNLNLLSSSKYLQ